MDDHVPPGAHCDADSGSRAGASGAHRLNVRLAAPAEGGGASAAVCAAAAAAFGLPKQAIAVTAGAKSRQKTLTVETDDETAFRARFDALAKATA